MTDDKVDKVKEMLNSEKFHQEHANFMNKMIDEAVEEQPIAPEDAEEAKKGGKLHGDPLFIVGK